MPPAESYIELQPDTCSRWNLMSTPLSAAGMPAFSRNDGRATLQFNVTSAGTELSSLIARQ